MRYDQRLDAEVMRLFLHGDAPAPAPEDAGKTLGRVDAAIDGLCPCGAEPREGSAYCSEDCEPTHRGPDTDSLWLGGPHAARWRPDLVSAFDESGWTLLDQTHRDDTGLDYCTYIDADSDRAFLRVDDGHRFVGLEVPWSELEASGPSEPFRRLERELADPRRLDSDEAGEEPDLPPIVCMQCGDLHPSPPPERCSCGLELGYVRVSGASGRLVPVDLVALPDNTMMVRVRDWAGLGVRRQLTDEYLMLPGSCEERIDRAWIELQHELRGMLREGTVPPAPRAMAAVDPAPSSPTSGAVFWLPDPPANPEAPTMADLAGGVDLTPYVAPAGAQPTATWVDETHHMDLAALSRALEPRERTEYHVCRWEPLLDSLRPHRCMLRWSDGTWCDQTTTNPDTDVRTTQRLPASRSAES